MTTILFENLEAALTQHKLDIEKLKADIPNIASNTLEKNIKKIFISVIKKHETEINDLRQKILQCKEKIEKAKDNALDILLLKEKKKEEQERRKAVEEREKIEREKIIRLKQYEKHWEEKSRHDEIQRKVRAETLALSARVRGETLAEKGLSYEQYMYEQYLKEKPHHEAIQMKLRTAFLQNSQTREHIPSKSYLEYKPAQYEPRTLNNCWHNPGGASICTQSNAMNPMVYNPASGIYEQ